MNTILHFIDIEIGIGTLGIRFKEVHSSIRLQKSATSIYQIDNSWSSAAQAQCPTPNVQFPMSNEF